jgi:beta-glucosidase
MRLRTKKILLRHAYRQKKLSLVTGWKAFSLASGPIALILVILLIVLSIFDNTLAAFVGGNFHELVNEDPNAIYYEGAFESPEEMVEYGLKLTELVEAEGAALLLNENNALPLAAGSKVSCISSSSVNLVYGGTGSGNIDASTANTLKDALTNSGFLVNDLLWKFYSEVATEYLRPVGGVVTTEAATISECPWEY